MKSANTAFQHFVPEDFLNELGRNEITEVKLGDQVEKIISVMFTDIRSFTSISESLSPSENFKFLNHFLGHIAPVIQRNNGFIDKFMGDGIMALFSRKPDDALNAAIQMFTKLPIINKSKMTQDPIRIGVGAHFGKLMLGVIGDEDRMETTAISDVVNTTSRLEGLNKSLGTNILISEEFAKNITSDTFLLRPLNRVKIRGRKAPIRIIEVYNSDQQEQIALKNETLEIFADGITSFENRNIDKAKKAFSEIINLNPSDQPAQAYLRALQKNIE